MQYIKKYEYWSKITEQAEIELDSKKSKKSNKNTDDVSNDNESNKIELNRTPPLGEYQKLIDDGVLELNKVCVDAFINKTEVDIKSLIKAGSNYIGQIKEGSPLKQYINNVRLNKVKDTDHRNAYKNINSGSWGLKALAKNGKETFGFFWIPVDDKCTKFILKPSFESRYGGYIAWSFSDNLWYPVYATKEEMKNVNVKGHVLNGFGNKNKASKEHTFKAGDIVYVVMNYDQEAQSGEWGEYMKKYSGLQYISERKVRSKEYPEYKTEWKDSLAIDRARGKNTPAIGGYIILLNRPGSGSTGGIAGGGSWQYTAQYL